MTSLFRSYTTVDKERRGTDIKAAKQAKQNAKGARSFWESQVRSSRVVQVRRGSAEQSVAGVLPDGNDSDGTGMSVMEIQPDGVSEAETAIHKIVRDLRSDLESMHHEDLDISLRLASLQGEISSLEDELTEHGYKMDFGHTPDLEPSQSPSFSPPGSSTTDNFNGDYKSNSLQRNMHRGQMVAQSDSSADESAIRARRDSMREKHVASAVKFKRVNSYHGLQSARVILKPMAPAESVDRLEWNKPHLWPSAQRPQAPVSRSGSACSSAYQSESGETSLDSTHEVDEDSGSPYGRRRPTGPLMHRVRRGESSAATAAGAISPTSEDAFSQSPTSSSDYAVPSSVGASSSSATSPNTQTPPVRRGAVPPKTAPKTSGSPMSSSAAQSPSEEGAPSSHIVGRPAANVLSGLPSLDDDIRTRAVSGIHSEEIVAMYMERESSIRSELGLVRQGSKVSSLAKTFSKPGQPNEQKPAPFVRSASSSKRRTERVDSSIASSSSFRSSLRRRNSAHLSTTSEQLEESKETASATRPKHQSTTVNTYC
ncbi:uncharacterized protein LOC135806133 [Sycon ciliatum]|uniref:uncharacterized protein LOC135806133 n=1 Tax=Sycon ciliatum TaxID=27933 RepID=UPI0031F61E84